MKLVSGSLLFEYIQIIFNGLLIALLVFFIFRSKKDKNSFHEKARERLENMVKSLTDIAHEHEKISKQFEENLEVRRSLILELTSQLDQLINRAKETILQLEKTMEEARRLEGRSSFNFGNPEHEKIIDLARKGFTLQSIAQQVNKSVGEVEFIVNLYRAAIRKKEFS